MDTGLELSAAELPGRRSTGGTDGCLATQREQRRAAQQLRHVPRLSAVQHFS